MKKPEWFKIKIPSGKNYLETKYNINKYKLNTVCYDAKCPNIGKCWNNKSATIMILGNICTRNCSFCAIKSGNPNKVDLKEPNRIAQLIKKIALNYIVITSVTRDDLSDKGAKIFALTINSIKKYSPKIKIEILTPDFMGEKSLIHQITKEKPFVFAHNIETVKNISKKIRDKKADYQTSLQVLKTVKEFNSKIYTKSSIMLGLGETGNQIIETMKDLRKANCDILSLGQYLQPTKQNTPVKKFFTPQEFEEFKKIAYNLGFLFVNSGPLVRSSYNAHEIINLN